MITHEIVSELRRLIRDAARIHEESWVPGEGERSGRYAISIDEAALEVCSTCPELQTPIYLLLQPPAWNDVLDWANS